MPQGQPKPPKISEYYIRFDTCFTTIFTISNLFFFVGWLDFELRCSSVSVHYTFSNPNEFENSKHPVKTFSAIGRSVG